MIANDSYHQKQIKYQNQFNILVEKYNEQKFTKEENLLKKIEKNQLKLQTLNKAKQSYLENNLIKKINVTNIKIEKVEKQINNLKQQPITLKFSTDPEVKLHFNLLKLQYIKDKDLSRIYQKISKEQIKLNNTLIQNQISKQSSLHFENNQNTLKQIKVLYYKNLSEYRNASKSIIQTHKQQLVSQGVVP
jgi:hypothetical protein